MLNHICQLIINYSLVGQEETTLEHSFRFRLSDMQSLFILTSQIEVNNYTYCKHSNNLPKEG